MKKESGPIYKQVFSSGPGLDVTDTEGVRRKLWMASEPGILRRREIMNLRKSTSPMGTSV